MCCLLEPSRYYIPIGSSYKYLGVLEAEGFQHIEVKSKVKEVYKQRLCLILKSKLSGCNQVRAINNYAVPVIRYTAAWYYRLDTK